MIRNCQFIILILLIIFKCLYADSEFLLMNNSADSLGKGSTGTAEYAGVDYALINPASTIKNKMQVSFSYMLLDNNLNYNYIGGGIPFLNGMLSVHLVYVSLPDTLETTGGDQLDDSLNYNDTCFILSDSFKLKDIASLGMSVKYIKREIAGLNAETYALDFGLIKEFNAFNFDKKYYNNLHVGASVKNMGGTIKFIQEEEELPRTFVFGIKYSPYFNWSVLYDINKVNNKDIGHLMGVEYKTPFFFIPRVGIRFEEETVIMTGMGIDYNLSFVKLNCDYSYNIIGQAVKNHSFSLGLEFLSL